jgi:hypothetical protein
MTLILVAEGSASGVQPGSNGNLTLVPFLLCSKLLEAY